MDQEKRSFDCMHAECDRKHACVLYLVLQSLDILYTVVFPWNNQDVDVTVTSVTICKCIFVTCQSSRSYWFTIIWMMKQKYAEILGFWLFPCFWDKSTQCLYSSTLDKYVYVLIRGLVKVAFSLKSCLSL